MFASEVIALPIVLLPCFAVVAVVAAVAIVAVVVALTVAVVGGDDVVVSTASGCSASRCFSWSYAFGYYSF